jgi:hypothetical protein
MLHATSRSETPSNGVDSIRSHGVSLTVDLSQKRKDGGALLSWKVDYILEGDSWNRIEDSPLSQPPTR